VKEEKTMRTMILTMALLLGGCTAPIETSEAPDAGVACGFEGATCCAQFPSCDEGLRCEHRPEAPICVPPPRPALAVACKLRCTVAVNCKDLPPHGEVACFPVCVLEWQETPDDSLHAIEQCLVERQDACGTYQGCWGDPCGALGEACCGGEACDDGLACGEVIGTGEHVCGAPVPSCGQKGEPCCEGPRPCDHLAGLACSDERLCTGEEP
jgi:hypothetical protein